MPNKIDSNITGLRWTEETSLKVLPGSPVWTPLEPNSYNDFGAQVTTVARNPINANRQRKKGVVTDVDASGAFNMDITQKNAMDILPGFFCAAWRKKSEVTALASVTTGPNTYTKAAGLDTYTAADIVFAEGFTNPANNGVKDVTTATATVLTVSQTLVAEGSPPATAKITRVGATLVVATADITTSGGYFRLNRASGAKDYTTFGLIPGEWVWLGGDAVGTKFVTAGNSGFCRVRAVAAGYIEFDKVPTGMANETGTGITLKIYFGNAIKNELSGLIVDKSYQLERSLGSAGYQYLTGAVANTLDTNIGTADKINIDMGFLACDEEQVLTGARKSGTFPALVEADAFNTSSDFSRIRMAAAATPQTALMTFFTEFKLTIDNGASAVKAVANVGAVDISKGDFSVSGTFTALFSDIASCQAVRNNTAVTFDFAVCKNNAGILLDVPYVALGDGRLNVVKDQPITIPLTADAAEDPTLHHTALLMNFSYLPSAAEA